MIRVEKLLIVTGVVAGTLLSGCNPKVNSASESKGDVMASSDSGPRMYSKPVYGTWVTPQMFASESLINDIVERAKRAGLNTLYPMAYADGCAYFKTSAAPLCSRAKLGFAPDSPLGLVRFTEIAQQKGLDVIPWFEKFMQNSQSSFPADQLEPKVPQLHIEETAKVVNVANETVKQRLLQIAVDATLLPGVKGIHIDDHMEYYANKGANRDIYTEKLNTFVEWLGSNYHTKAPGKFFEISQNPLGWSSSQYFAYWNKWTQVDRIIVQCYKPSVETLIGCAQDESKNSPRIIGNGFMAVEGDKVFTVPNDITDSKARKIAIQKGVEAIAQVARAQKAAGRSLILWKVDALYTDGVVEALAKALK